MKDLGCGTHKAAPGREAKALLAVGTNICNYECGMSMD